jgi:hypothetical protein
MQTSNVNASGISHNNLEVQLAIVTNDSPARLTQSESFFPCGTPISSNVFGPLPGGRFCAGLAGAGVFPGPEPAGFEPEEAGGLRSCGRAFCLFGIGGLGGYPPAGPYGAGLLVREFRPEAGPEPGGREDFRSGGISWELTLGG